MNSVWNEYLRYCARPSGVSTQAWDEIDIHDEIIEAGLVTKQTFEQQSKYLPVYSISATNFGLTTLTRSEHRWLDILLACKSAGKIYGHTGPETGFSIG